MQREVREGGDAFTSTRDARATRKADSEGAGLGIRIGVGSRGRGREKRKHQRRTPNTEPRKRLRLTRRASNAEDWRISKIDLGFQTFAAWRLCVRPVPGNRNKNLSREGARAQSEPRRSMSSRLRI